MICLSNIKGVGLEKPCVSLTWKPKETRKKINKLSSFKIHINEEAMDELREPTRIKLELLIDNLWKFYLLGEIKTEADLIIFVNRFMKDYAPAILFLGKRHFEFETHKDGAIVSFNNKLVLSRKYLKKKFRERTKEFMQEYRNE